MRFIGSFSHQHPLILSVLLNHAAIPAQHQKGILRLCTHDQVQMVNVLERASTAQGTSTMCHFLAQHNWTACMVNEISNHLALIRQNRLKEWASLQ